MDTFQSRLQLLLSGDPLQLYLQQVERNVHGENQAQSQLGRLTMINDYGAQLAWRFERDPRTRTA
jgi:hypothetical protein